MPDDNDNQTPDYDPDNPRCNQKQLKFLKECIDKGPEGIKKWNQWFEGKGPEIWLQRAALLEADLKGAHLREADIRKADFSDTFLHKDKLSQSNS